MSYVPCPGGSTCDSKLDIFVIRKLIYAFDNIDRWPYAIDSRLYPIGKDRSNKETDKEKEKEKEKEEKKEKKEEKEEKEEGKSKSKSILAIFGHHRIVIVLAIFYVTKSHRNRMAVT